MIPLKIGPLNFECAVLESNTPVMLVFGAMWDKNSRMQFDLLEYVSEKYNKKIIVGIVDYDYAPDIFSECKVYDIPTTVIFEDGKEFSRRFGYYGVSAVIDFLNYFFGVLPY